MEKVLFSNSADETMKLGEKIGTGALNGSVFCLTGDLGAGKTTLVRGVAKRYKLVVWCNPQLLTL